MPLVDSFMEDERAHRQNLSGAINGLNTTTAANFTSATPGTVPASSGGTTNFLRADGTWATPTGSLSGAAKAWLVVTGGASPSIAASFNVTSVTDNGPGDFSVNLTTPFSTASYALAGGGNIKAATDNSVLGWNEDRVTPSSVAQIGIYTMPAFVDTTRWSASFFGNQ